MVIQSNLVRTSVKAPVSDRLGWRALVSASLSRTDISLVSWSLGRALSRKPGTQVGRTASCPGRGLPTRQGFRVLEGCALPVEQDYC